MTTRTLTRITRYPAFLLWGLVVALLCAMWLSLVGGAPASASSTAPTYALASQGGSTIPADNLLPMQRWASPNLTAFNQSLFGISLPNLSSGPSTVFFSVAAWAWAILTFLLNFGMTFSPLKKSASEVNSAVAAMGDVVSFFLIPLLLWLLIKNVKIAMRGNIGRFLSKVSVAFVLAAAVMSFTNTAHRVDGKSDAVVLNTTGTAPWAANVVVGNLSSVSSSISYIPKPGSGPSTAFYDTGAQSGTALTCKKYDENLYRLYRENAKSQLGLSRTQSEAMVTMSKLWEQTLLSPWISAQFGSGSVQGNQWPSQLACRQLEASVDESDAVKAAVFAAATEKELGWSAETVIDTNLVNFMQPLGDQYIIPNNVAWAYCSVNKNKTWERSTPLLKAGDKAKAYGDERTMCGDEHKFGGMTPTAKAPTEDGDRKALARNVLLDAEGNYHYLEDGPDEDINEAIAADKVPEAGPLRDTIVKMQSDSPARMFHSTFALGTSAAYLWALGPLAVGLTLAGLAMVFLLALLPLMLLLWMVDHPAAKKMLHALGWSALAMCLFTFALSFLTWVIGMAAGMVNAASPGESAVKSVIMAVVPLLALFLLSSGAKKLGFGNLMTPRQSFGMAQGMASRAIGSGQAPWKTDRNGNTPAQRQALSQKEWQDRRKRALAAGSSAAGKSKKLFGAAGRKVAEKSPLLAAAAGLGALAGAKVAKTSSSLRSGSASVGRLAASKALGSTPAGYAKSITGRLGRFANRAIPSLGLLNRPSAVSKDGSTPVLKTGDYLRAFANNSNQSAAEIRKELLDRKAAKLSTERLSASTPAGVLSKLGAAAGLKTLDSATGAPVAPLTLSTSSPDQVQSDHKKLMHGVSKIPTMEARDAAYKELVSRGLTGALSAQLAVNPKFAGLKSAAESDAFTQALAQDLGLHTNQLVVGSSGLVTIAPVPKVKNGQAPALPEGVSLEAVGHPALYLPATDAARAAGESDDQWTARVNGILVSRGLMGQDGRPVDMLARAGFDIHKAEDQAAIRSWLAGNANERLDAIRQFEELTAPAPHEAVMVEASREWAAEHATSVEAQRVQMRLDGISPVQSSVTVLHDAANHHLVAANVLSQGPSALAGRAAGVQGQKVDQGVETVSNMLAQQAERALQLFERGSSTTASDVQKTLGAFLESVPRMTGALEDLRNHVFKVDLEYNHPGDFGDKRGIDTLTMERDRDNMELSRTMAGISEAINRLSREMTDRGDSPLPEEEVRRIHSRISNLQDLLEEKYNEAVDKAAGAAERVAAAHQSARKTEKVIAPKAKELARSRTGRK